MDNKQNTNITATLAALTEASEALAKAAALIGGTQAERFTIFKNFLDIATTQVRITNAYS